MAEPISEGTHAARPAASADNLGCFYKETNGGMFQSDGTNWIPAGPPLVKLFTPVLQGGTDNPVSTFTTQIGRYYQIGKLCFVDIVLVSTTMTKTTLTDNLRVSLPVAAANVAGAVQLLKARVENGTAVVNGSAAETVANAAYLQFCDIPDGAASVLITYAALSLGVLTNTITVHVSGFYETV